MSLRIAIVLVVAEVVIGSVGFAAIEGFGLVDSIYMTILAMSTVGYGEVEPLSQAGRIFATVLIVVNLGIFTYTASAFSFYIINGEFFKNLHSQMIQSKISDLTEHVIICGYGRYGKEVRSHLASQNIGYVVIEKSDEKIKQIQEVEDKILYLQGDATQDDNLLAAGIERASSLVTAMADDGDNLYTVLSARLLNPSLNIISRSQNADGANKLQMAGANHVITPEQIGGFYMATLISKPDAVDFFTFITNEQESEIRFGEIHYNEFPDDLKGKSLSELNLRKVTGVNVIAHKSKKGKYHVNPGSDTALKEGESFIFISDASHIGRLPGFLKE